MIRKFVVNVVLVVVSFSAATVILYAVSNWIARMRNVPELPDSVDVLIVGDSHPECAFNDGLIPRARNLGRSAEPYFFVYEKLKGVIAHSNLKYVLIEYNNGQLLTSMDEMIWGADRLPGQLAIFGYLLDKDDMWMLAKKDSKVFFSSLSVAMRKNFDLISAGNFNPTSDTRWGGFIAHDHVLDSSALGEAVKFDSDLTPFSETNILYLEKCIELCRQHSIKVMLIRSPVHKEYRGRSNELTFEHVRETRLKDLDLLDFWDMPLEMNEFADLHHLNKKGARRFSTFFNALLNQGLLESKDKDAFIQERMIQAEESD